MARRVGGLLVAVWVALAVVAGGAAQAQKGVVVVGPGDSIQAAVDAAKPRETIIVRGEHHEKVAITTDGITLRGQRAVLEPASIPTQNACFDPSAPEDVNLDPPLSA